MEAEQLADLGIAPAPGLAPSGTKPVSSAGGSVVPVTAGSSLVEGSSSAGAGTGAGGGGGAPEVDLLGLMSGDDVGGGATGPAKGGSEFQKGTATRGGVGP